MIVTLAGGVGAARFLEGLSAVAESITVIGNTGDDLEWQGLHISPDLDTVAYTLAGVASSSKGWGVEGDTFECLQWMGRYTTETWFRLGDRDLATHLFRTSLLREGKTLSEASEKLCQSLGVRARLLPMTNGRLRTKVETDEGALDFQVYFVARRTEPEVRAIVFDGAEACSPAPGVLEAIAGTAGVILCPSNPLISIGPILAVPGIRRALQQTSAPVAAISPIVGGRALKGPADRMMRAMNLTPSARQVAAMYRDFVKVFVIDHADREEAAAIEALGMKVVVTDTVMKDKATKTALARATLEAMGL